MTNVIARTATFAVALVVGAVYGTAATVAHSFAVGWFPLGLVLAVVGSGAFLLALRLLTGDRWAALSGGAGLFLAALVFSQVGLGGSKIVAPQSPATTWVPVAWTLSVAILIALVVTWPDFSRLRTPPRDERAPEGP